jgi:FkbM family methyltransferase
MKYLTEGPGLQRFIYRIYQLVVKEVGATKITRVPGIRKVLRALDMNLVRPSICPSGDDLVVTVQGHKMHIGHPERALGFPDLLLDSYERGTTYLFNKLVRSGMVVLDVGACVGYYTLIAARLVGVSGRVYAFEPDPTNYELLLKNISLNKYENIIAVQKAVSNETGQANLYLSNKNIGAHSMYFNDRVSSHTVTVPTITIDDFWQSLNCPTAHLIKMDIEGAEIMALEGMKRLCQQESLKLIIEANSITLSEAGASPDELLSKLEAFGFRVSVISPTGLELLPLSSLLKKAVTLNLLCEK